MTAAVDFGNFGDWAQTLYAAPPEIPSIRRVSVGEETNAAYRRHSIGAVDREPTYHAFEEAKYVLPNESVNRHNSQMNTADRECSFPEHVRLETQAVHISEMMHGHVLHAPVNPRAERVLDIGCGTGIVTDLMSGAYPHAECIGLDLSAVPGFREHKDNIRFFQGNAAAQKATDWVPNDKHSDVLPRDDELFDHIFSRLLIAGMNDWPSFIKKEYGLLKPGGWAEVQDLAWHWYSADGSIASNDWKWLQLLNKSLESEGLDTLCGLKAEQWMQKAGFIDIKVIPYVFPVCGMTESTQAMRDFGKFNAESVPVLLHHAIAKAICPDGNADGEMQAMIEGMREEMKECLRPGQGLYQLFYVTIGRKPE